MQYFIIFESYTDYDLDEMPILLWEPIGVVMDEATATMLIQEKDRKYIMVDNSLL